MWLLCYKEDLNSLLVSPIAVFDTPDDAKAYGVSDDLVRSLRITSGGPWESANEDQLFNRAITRTFNLGDAATKGVLCVYPIRRNLNKRGMLPISEVYEPSRWGWSDYTPLLMSFGYEVVIKFDETGYQGDSYVLFKDNDQYGYLCFGWGSCSGCDALQACTTFEEVDSLRQELFSAIVWNDANGLLDYMNNHDWEGDYVWRVDEFKEFLEAAKTYLGSIVGKTVG